MKTALRTGSSALVLVSIMFLGSLVMWVAMPVGWLWVAGHVQAASGSVGIAFLVALVGVIVSIGVIVPLLGWLSNRHRDLRVARGYADSGHLVLEVVLVTSATVALLLFGAWFFLFAGTSPIPVNIGY